MKINKNKLMVGVMALATILGGCDKTKEYDLITPPVQSSFINTTTATYYIKNDPTSIYKIPVGITTLSSMATNVNVTASSSTGAVSGTQYTLPSTTITIPAGKAMDSLSVKGLFAGYPGARKDTLTFKITGGDVPATAYNNTFNLIMQKYCDVVSTDLLGNYTKSRDYDKTLAGTPSALSYTASISSWTVLSATTATVLIKNLCGTTDIGLLPFAASDPAATGILATLNWTSPSNFTVTIASQPYVASLYSYGASTISGTGSFSSCDQTFTIITTVRVSAGAFNPIASVLLR